MWFIRNLHPTPILIFQSPSESSILLLLQGPVVRIPLADSDADQFQDLWTVVSKLF